jgi:hypothetical protein
MSAHAAQAEPTGLFGSLKRFARRLKERLVAGVRWLRDRASALLRKLRSPFAAVLAAAAGDGEPSFGARWLSVTLVVAIALGLVLAAVLSPVVGLLTLIGVGVWALMRRTTRRRRNSQAADSWRRSVSPPGRRARAGDGRPDQALRTQFGAPAPCEAVGPAASPDAMDADESGRVQAPERRLRRRVRRVLGVAAQLVRHIERGPRRGGEHREHQRAQGAGPQHAGIRMLAR